MTNVAPDGTVKVEPDCTVNGPATSALSLAANVKFCVSVCTFRYTPLIVVNLSYEILASAGVPASKLFPSKIPKNVSVVFVAPFAAIRLIQLNQNIVFNSLFLASCLITLELSRFFLLGGFPWLLPGLVFLDTFGQAVIPIFGVYGASYIIYFLASFIALSILEI